MPDRSSIGAAVLAAALLMPIAFAKAEDAKKYPDWDALWIRGSPVGAWDPANPPGKGQKPPLKPEYQKIWQANLAKQAAGQEFDIKSTCGPVGMPRVMTLYEPIEIVVKPKVTYMLAESMSPIRRIFTDGREWPKANGLAFVGYSIGKWSDSTNSGTYDTLEVETRDMRGPRLMDSTGIPLAADNETVVKEKLYLDKSDPNILRNEITTYDNAFTQPWTVSRFYRREKNPLFVEYNCTEDNKWVTIGGQLYLVDGDGYIMPIQQNQPPPDLKYFQKYWGQAKK
jgi:hypothetical protein